jgi:murein DD-endopeptidase MepM/ murein hydrolase activator NlpD
VDYGAAAGTPVRAVAAGTVEFAGWNGEGGKTVKLRHAGGYETSYMHLSKVLVRSGVRVSQGDLIGQVGMTGLATGPHLDFRLLFHGKYQNPATKITAPGPPVAQNAMVRFASVRDALRTRLDRINFRN